MKAVFLFLILVFGLAPIFGQNPAEKAASGSGPQSKKLAAAKMLENLKALAADEMEGRGIGTKGGEKARAFVAAEFKRAGLKPFGDSFFQPFDFTARGGETLKAANVVGFIEGGKYKDRYIVVSAHYDHVGVRGGEIYNGADDDASGTAALVALAEYFRKHKPAHSLVFAAFDGEESGLRGSRYFVDNPPVKIESIALDVNLDMVSRSDKNELYAAGPFHYPLLKPALAKAAAKSRIKLVFGHDRPELKDDDWTSQSDHGSFHRKKIPFVYFGVEDHKDYHRPTDDFENINQEFYVRAVETILDAVKELDKDLK